MQFKPLLGSIEAVIKASAANNLIKRYRTYLIEPGVIAVPACVTGTSRSLKLDEAFIGDTPDTCPRLWMATIGISVLTRGYSLPAQVVKAAEEVDAAQAAVYSALNVDSTLNDACVQSWVDAVQEIVLLKGEYFGYSLILKAQVFEP